MGLFPDVEPEPERTVSRLCPWTGNATVLVLQRIISISSHSNLEATLEHLFRFFGLAVIRRPDRQGNGPGAAALQDVVGAMAVGDAEHLLDPSRVGLVFEDEFGAVIFLDVLKFLLRGIQIMHALCDLIRNN